MRKLVALSLIIIASFAQFFGVVSAANPTTCDASNTKQAIQCGIGGATGVPVSAAPDTSINNTISSAINILSVLVGIAATVMIIIGGFRYVTSAGDSTKVANARKTVMYALIGLVIVALSQLIIKFVLTKAVSPTTTGSSSQTAGGGTKTCTSPTGTTYAC